MLRMLTGEALAYLRLGITMPTARRIDRHNGASGEFGIVFVPGVGANGAQFTSLKRTLAGEADYFDAFEYFSLRNIERVADELATFLDDTARRCPRYLVVGHSLGGVLLRMVLQRKRPPNGVAGFVSICAPLAGTWRAKRVPWLRALVPDSRVMTELESTTHRLADLDIPIVTIGARRDQFLRPHTTAFLEGFDTLELDGVAHAGSLFDERTRQALVTVARRVSP